MKRRDFLRMMTGAAMATVLPASSFGAGGIGKRKHTNIIFIMVDDLGYADLGCYGQKHIKTPNLDRMASEGMRFTDVYSGCTVCAPARSVLMTGYHMGHASVRGNTGGIPLRDEDVTVAEVLQRAGYVCGGFGKWGLGDVRTPGAPEEHGFDTFFGYYHQVHAHEYYPAYLWRNSKKAPLAGNAEGKRGQYSHYLIFERTMKFIRENRGRPFFCYLPWTPPHGKYEIPSEDPAWQMYKDKPWPREAKVVAAMSTMIDRHVGGMLALLGELKIADRTIVFFCSDNGAARRFEGVLDSCGPLRGFKRSLYEGGIRVPMIVRWPGTVKAGVVSDHVWYFADVMPTFAELAGAASPKGIDGISVTPTLLGENAVGRKQQEREFLYWEWARYNWSKRQNIPGGLTRAVRMGKWKAVLPKFEAPLELYDLSKDIGEKKNVAAQHADVVAKIEAYLRTCRTAAPPQVEPEKARGRRYR